MALRAALRAHAGQPAARRAASAAPRAALATAAATTLSRAPPLRASSGATKQLHADIKGHSLSRGAARPSMPAAGHLSVAEEKRKKDAETQAKLEKKFRQQLHGRAAANSAPKPQRSTVKPPSPQTSNTVARGSASSQARNSKAGSKSYPGSADKSALVEEWEKKLSEAKDEKKATERIAAKDVENARKWALKSEAKTLLEVADNMERAVGSVNPTDLEDPKIRALLESIRDAQGSLLAVFEGHGITKIDASVGAEFDPAQHEALMQMPWAEGKVAGTIGSMFATGYDYKGQVLRAAKCAVIAEQDG